MKIKEQIEERKFEDLSSDEQAEVKRKRSVFKELHDNFQDKEIYDVEGKLGIMEVCIKQSFEKMMPLLRISDLKFPDADDDFMTAMNLLKDHTVFDALDAIKHLVNGMQFERYTQTKNLTLKDLNLTIYE